MSLKKRFINNNIVNLYRITTLGGRHYMVRWKLFGRSKSKEELESEELIQEEPEETMQSDIEQEPEETILVEHRETLYTVDSKSKKSSSVKTKYREPYSQTSWRDVNAIEENVDNLRMSKTKEPVSELDKKVDKILSKRKKK